MTDPMPTILNILAPKLGRNTTLSSIRPLPYGWVEVLSWHGDELEAWAGPLIFETDTRYTISIGGEPMHFLKTAWRQVGRNPE